MDEDIKTELLTFIYPSNDVASVMSRAAYHIEQLEKEVERLKKVARGWYVQNIDLIRQRDKVWEENQQLRHVGKERGTREWATMQDVDNPEVYPD